MEAGLYVVLSNIEGGVSEGSLLRPEATDLTVGDTTGLGAALTDHQLELFARLRVRREAVIDQQKQLVEQLRSLWVALCQLRPEDAREHQQ